MERHHVPKRGRRAPRLIVYLVLIAFFLTLPLSSHQLLLIVLTKLFPPLKPPTSSRQHVPDNSWVHASTWTPPSRYVPQVYPFAFPNIADWLLTCVKLHLWFYNTALRSMLNSSWTTWTHALFIRAWGPLAVSSCRIFDKNNPRHRPRQDRSISAPKLKLLYALNAIAVAGQNATIFRLSSESSFTNHLRKYRGYQGALDSTKLHHDDLLALRQMLHLTSETMEAPLATTNNSFTAIVDTGCSITCTNSPYDFVPGTLQALPKPITLGGIAGGLQVREQGLVSWEFLNDFGVVETLETKASFSMILVSSKH